MGRLDSIRLLLATPGAPTLALFGLLGRAPMSMLSVAFVAAAASLGEQGGYGLGGTAAGAYALASAVVGPAIGRLVDRHGQTRLGRWLGVASAIAATLAIVSLLAGAAIMLVPLAALVGATQPNVGAFARARWAALLERQPTAQTAQALESINDELSFLIGPALVALLATVGFVGLPIAVAMTLLLVGVFGITSRWSLVAPAPHREATEGPPWRPRFEPGAGLLVSTAFLGATLGAAQVVQLAYATALGMPEGAALVFFVYSAASLVGAFVVAAVPWPMPARRRYSIALVGLAIGMAPTALVSGYVPFVLVAALAGLGIAPTFIQANGVVAEETPPGTRTQAFAILGSATVFGIAIGSAVAGISVDAVGADQARLVLIPLGLLAAASAIIGDRVHGQRMRRAAAGSDAADEAPPMLPAPVPPAFPTGGARED